MANFRTIGEQEKRLHLTLDGRNIIQVHSIHDIEIGGVKWRNRM